MRSPSNPLPAILAALLVAGSAFAWEPEEDVLGRLVRLHTEKDAADTPVAEAAAQAAATLPAGPYRAAARSIQAWRLLKAGQSAEAAKLYEALLADPATPSPFGELAKRWLTRLDREQVADALKREWGRSIRYPDNLAALPPPAPPLADRWGQAWRYRPASYKILRSEAQRYDLQSLTLEADSDLAAALTRPWPEAPSLKPQRITPGIGPTVIVFHTSRTPPETVSLSEGKSAGGVALVKVGPKTLLMVEGDFVFLLPKPGI